MFQIKEQFHYVWHQQSLSYPQLSVLCSYNFINILWKRLHCMRIYLPCNCMAWTETESFKFPSMIHKFHAYEEAWTPSMMIIYIDCTQDASNRYDPLQLLYYIKGEEMVGYVPKKISAPCFLFLRKGSSIQCQLQIKENHCYSEDLPQGCMKIYVACIFCFKELKMLWINSRSYLTNNQVGHQLVRK